MGRTVTVAGTNELVYRWWMVAITDGINSELLRSRWRFQTVDWRAKFQCKLISPVLADDSGANLWTTGTIKADVFNDTIGDIFNDVRIWPTTKTNVWLVASRDESATRSVDVEYGAWGVGHECVSLQYGSDGRLAEGYVGNLDPWWWTGHDIYVRSSNHYHNSNLRGPAAAVDLIDIVIPRIQFQTAIAAKVEHFWRSAIAADNLSLAEPVADWVVSRYSSNGSKIERPLRLVQDSGTTLG